MQPYFVEDWKHFGRWRTCKPSFERDTALTHFRVFDRLKYLLRSLRIFDLFGPFRSTHVDARIFEEWTCTDKLRKFNPYEFHPLYRMTFRKEILFLQKSMGTINVKESRHVSVISNACKVLRLVRPSVLSQITFVFIHKQEELIFARVHARTVLIYFKLRYACIQNDSPTN